MALTQPLLEILQILSKVGATDGHKVYQTDSGVRVHLKIYVSVLVKAYMTHTRRKSC